MRIFNTEVDTIWQYLYYSKRSIATRCEFPIFAGFVMLNFEANFLSDGIIDITNILILVLLHLLFTQYERSNDL